MTEKRIKSQTQALETYEIPAWEALPTIGLYMDQVLILMEEYLRVYKGTDDKLITPSMINNYVKLGVIPKPEKKRYGRVHLAYLIMVCSLKQVLSISMIQGVLPLTLKEREVEQAYTAFKSAQEQVFNGITAQVMESFRNLQEKKEISFADYFGAYVKIALTGNIYKILAENLAEQTNNKA